MLSAAGIPPKSKSLRIYRDLQLFHARKASFKLKKPFSALSVFRKIRANHV